MLFRTLTAGSSASPSSVAGWLVSIGVHGVLAAAAVAGGLEPPLAPDEDSPWSRVIYLAPPQSTGGTERTERITYVGLDGGTGGTNAEADAGPTAEELEAARRRAREAEELAALEQRKGTAGAEGDQEMGEVFLESQVENPAAYDATSAAPMYPELLRARSVEGGVIVQFVVDTTGRADTTSFQVLQTSHQEFAMSVRTALPGMRFAPAEANGTRVRQLVQIPFLFRIETATLASDTQRDSVP
jgi:protein TonB